MYYLWFAICDKTLTEVSVSGSTVWKNPAGYLPGMMAPFLNFYGFMSAVSFQIFVTLALEGRTFFTIFIFLADVPSPGGCLVPSVPPVLARHF